MGSLTEGSYETIRVRVDKEVCFLQIYRPDDNNTINERLVEECLEVLSYCEVGSKVVVLEGLPDVFCFGADFKEIEQRVKGQGSANEAQPERLYDLYLQLATGPYVTVAHVRGRTNAGGIGLVAACDLVLAENKAVFSLSELLFGLMPACVLPFLIRKVGPGKANYMTLLTQPISAQKAEGWGLVDLRDDDSEDLLRKQLLRLRRLGKKGIERYKRYSTELDDGLARARPLAIRANREVFGDAENEEKIARYVNTGKFPWEPD